jgi:hypothetical protein
MLDWISFNHLIKMSFQTHLISTSSLIQNISIIFVNMKPLHPLTNSYSQKLISQGYLVINNIFQTNENFNKGKKL